MRHFLLILAVVMVGCGEGKEKAAEPARIRGLGTFKKIKSPKETPSKSVEIANPVVEAAIRKQLKKPTGELTKADLVKVTSLYLSGTEITDAGLKEVAKLQKLTLLLLYDTKITKAGVAELKKALPKCRIDHTATK